MRAFGVVIRIVSFVLCIVGAAGSAVAKPPNDAVVKAVPLTDRVGPFFFQDLDGATVEPGEPLPFGRIHGQHTVWYKFTAAQKGLSVIDVSRFYEGGALLAVYTRSTSGRFTLVAKRGIDTTNSTLLFPTTKGQTYWVQLDSTYWTSFAQLYLAEFGESGGIAVTAQDARFFDGLLATSLPTTATIQSFRVINATFQTQKLVPQASIGVIDPTANAITVPPRNAKAFVAGQVTDWRITGNGRNPYGTRWGKWLHSLTIRRSTASGMVDVVSFPMLIESRIGSQGTPTFTLSRSVLKGTFGKTVSTYATVTNPSAFRMVDCTVASDGLGRVTLKYRAVNPTTREPVAAVYEPVDIPANRSVGFFVQILRRDLGDGGYLDPTPLKRIVISCANGTSSSKTIEIDLGW